MTAEELYEKEFGNIDSVPKESVIRLLRHFGKVLDMEHNAAQQSKMDYSEVGVYDIANKWASYLPIGHIIEGRDTMVADIYGLLNAHAETIAQKMIKEQQSKMPTENEIEAESFERYNDKVTGYIQIQKYHAFIKGAEWLRNQITER